MYNIIIYDYHSLFNNSNIKYKTLFRIMNLPFKTDISGLF